MSFVRVNDTRLMQLDPRDAQVAVMEGARNVAYVPLTSAALSTSNCNFNLNNIGSQVCRSRRQCMRLGDGNLAGNPAGNIRFTVSITTGFATGDIFDSIGFKSWPLNRSISNISHTINQSSYSLNINQIIDAISKFDLETKNANFYDNTAYDAVSSYELAQGTYLNPIQPFASIPAGWGLFKPRSNNILLSTNSSIIGTQTVVITCSLYEPLCSPFNNIGKDDDHSLYAINGETLQLQFVNDLFNNMLACTFAQAGTVINSVAVSFPATATLECVYLTPSESFARELPQNSISHYNNYSIFSIDGGAVAAGATTTLTSPVAQFTGLPFKVLVYVRQSDATKNINIPDRYLQIVNVQNCQIDNGPNVLGGASMDQLYEISSRNGCVLDRDVWQQKNLNGLLTPVYGCGSILALSPKQDLSVRESVTSGSPGRFIFQITLSLKNNTTDNFAGTTMYVVAITNGILERNGNEYKNYLYTLPPNAIMDAQRQTAISHVEFKNAQQANMFLSGGSFKSFFSKIWNGVKNAGKWAWDHRDAIVDAGKEAYNLAKKVGLGEDEQNMGGNFISKYKHPKRRMDLFYQ